MLRAHSRRQLVGDFCSGEAAISFGEERTATSLLVYDL
jgi:hypothetical protein